MLRSLGSQAACGAQHHQGSLRSKKNGLVMGSQRLPLSRQHLHLLPLISLEQQPIASSSSVCVQSAAFPLIHPTHSHSSPSSTFSNSISSADECSSSSSSSSSSITSICNSAPSTSKSKQQQREEEALVRTLTRCKNLFLCVAAFAAWAYFSHGNGIGEAPIASIAATAQVTSLSSFHTTVKSAWTGLAAGVLHTLCGPDHLAALTPLTIGRNRMAASALGALWGFGHSTGQLILGLGIVLLKDRFNQFLPFFERWSGSVVALTLIAIGILGIYESHFAKDDGHAEEEQETMKMALAGGAAGVAAASAGVNPAQSNSKGLATYATGIVYGLQPDALFVVIPALALPTKAAAFAHCTMFVLGTVMAMGGYTLLIGTTSAALTRERPWLQAHLSTVASIFAITVGVLLALAGAGIEVPFLS